MAKPPAPDSSFWTIFHAATRMHVAVFKVSGGRIGGRLGQAPILLLNHVGRKSGKQRTTPLIYLDDHPNAVVVASKAGVDSHPAWFHNLMAMESTSVHLPRRGRHQARPRVAQGTERERLWPRLVSIHKSYDDYASYTDRKIPVVILEPM